MGPILRYGCGRPDGDAKLGLGPPLGGGWIRGMSVRFAAMISLLSGGLALGACAMPDMDSFRAPDLATLLTLRSVTSFREKQLGPVAPEDMVDASGGCAGALVPAAGSAQASGQGNVSLQDAGVPMIPAAPALEMSECDVVKRAGIAEKVEIGTNDRAERTVTLTYINGQRPGVYYFTSGRLTSMERGAEPPPPPKTAKKPDKPPAKRTAQPSRT